MAKTTSQAIPPSTKKDSKFWLRLAGTLISIGLLVWLVSGQRLDEIWAVFIRIPISSLVEMALLMVVSRLAVICRWHALVKSGGGKITIAQSSRITLAGLFASNFLPSTIGGDVVRLFGAIQLGIESSLSTASLIADRLVGMTGMALALPWSFPYIFQAANKPALESFTAALPWGNKLFSKVVSFTKSTLSSLVRWLKHPAGLFIALFFTLVHTVCFFAIQWLALSKMGEPLPFMTVGGLYVLVYFVTLLPISINGYGLQELSVTFVYTQLAGVSPQTSLAVALILRTLTVVASLPGALFLPSLLKREPKIQEETSPTG